MQRLRPKLMTVTTMAAGLLPLLWADGPGAEITRGVAAPMIGGLASSAFLTLEVLPVLYTDLAPPAAAPRAAPRRADSGRDRKNPALGSLTESEDQYGAARPCSMRWRC